MRRCCKKSKRVAPDPSFQAGKFKGQPKLSLQVIDIEANPKQSMKIEEKRILNDPNHLSKNSFTRKMLGHRHTKGGNYYGIQVVENQDEDEKGTIKPVTALEMVEPEQNNMKIDSKEEFFEDIKDMSPVKNQLREHFDMNESAQAKLEILKMQSGRGSNEHNSPPSVSNKPQSNEQITHNLSKPELNLLRDLTEKQEDSNASMSRLSSIEAKSKKQLDNSNFKNDHNLELNLIKTEHGEEFKYKKKSSSVNKPPKRITGYRTLNYVDLFNTESQKIRQKEELGGSSKFLDHSSKEKQKMLSDKNLKISRSNSGSQMSINLGIENDGLNDINRNELSIMEISVLGKDKGNESSISKSTKMLSRMGREHKRVNSSKYQNESLMPEDDEVRLNKDLNTTYVRSSELVNPKKSYKDAGIVVTGKRTKINQYVLLTSIGKGGWGEVFLAIDVDSPEKHKYVDFFEKAMKVIDRRGLRSRLSNSHIDESVKTEIAILKSLDHPNIVKMYEALEDESSKKIYLVLEYCSKGGLLSNEFWKASEDNKNNFLVDDQSDAEKIRKLSLYQAKSYFVQIARGLYYRKACLTSP